MAYNCLLLDMDDTLLSFKESERESLIKVLEKYNIPATDENIQIYHDVNEGLWKEFEKGKIKKHVLEKTRFQKFGQAAGVEINHSEQMNRDYRGFLSQSAILFDGALEFLEDVEDYATIAIVTNGVEIVQQNRIKISGLIDFVDGVYTSEKVGAQKPNKQIFISALRDLGVEKWDKVLVVGDRLQSDIKGGINAGLDTCWINFSDEENTTNITPKYEVKDYTQLKNIILEGIEDVPFTVEKRKIQL